MDLAKFSEYNDRSSGASDSPNVSNIDKILDKLGSKSDSARVNLPTLKCITYSGTTKDTISFNIFYNQFMNVVGLRSEIVSKFEKGIEFKNNKHYVRIPWLPQIKEVLSNYHVALKVCQRVKQNLINQNLLNEYSNVFRSQVKEGILEQIIVKPHEINDYTLYLIVPSLRTMNR